MPSNPDRTSQLESEIAALKEQADHLCSRIADLRKALIERDGLIAIADEVAAIRRRQEDSLEHELALRKQALDTMLNSRSWRWTLPVRYASRCLAGLKGFLGWPGPPPVQTDHGNRVRESSRRLTYVHRVTDHVDASALDIKAVAFYLPKFGPVREMRPGDLDSAAGWARIGGGLPRYLGHSQPRVPDELGSYDFTAPETLKKQIAIARQFGIHGFCIYHYASGAKHALEAPLKHLVSDKSLDFPFCICWMKRDCGGESIAITKDLSRALADSRYIRIDGNPVLITDRSIFNDPAEQVRVWRSSAKNLGLPGLYLIALGDDDRETRALGFDAGIEVPAFASVAADVTLSHSLLDPTFAGRIYSYDAMVEKSPGLPASTVTFRSVLPGWDDESLRPGRGESLAGAGPGPYAKWLKQACDATMLRRPEERIVFINAWNAWAEGAYLEPDRKFGFAYLHATSNVLRCYHNDPETKKRIGEINAGFKRTSDTAIVFHCHYEDLIVPLFDQYFSRIKDADLFVTARNDISRSAVEEIYRRFPNVFFLCQENRGRDIRPFLLALRQLRIRGYAFACKVHSKKTPHGEIGVGDRWRRELMAALLGSPESVADAVRIFSQESDVGLLAATGSVMDLRVRHVHAQNTYWVDRLLYEMGRSDLVGKYAFDFPAGSMYWFRVSALAGFDDLLLKDDAFEPELGQVDGTLHHGVERVVAVYVQSQGFRMKEVVLGRRPDEPEVPAGRLSSTVRFAQDLEADLPAKSQTEARAIPEAIAKQLDQIRSLQGQLAKTERDLANETWVREQLMQSFSWRLTAPLRGIAKTYRSLRSVLKPSPAISAAEPFPKVEGKTSGNVDPDISRELNDLNAEFLKVDLRAFLSTGATLAFRSETTPEISVILEMTDPCEPAFACLRSLEIESRKLEVVILDDTSSAEASSLIARLSGVRVVRTRESRNRVAAFNRAAGFARGEYLLFLSGGTQQLLPGSLDAALSVIRRTANAGAVGGRIIHCDGLLEEAGSILWHDGSSEAYGKGDRASDCSYMFQRDVDYCSNCFLLTPRNIFIQMDGFSDSYGTAAYHDADYCLRLWERGKRVIYAPKAVAFHFEPARASSVRMTTEAKAHQDAFRRRHARFLEDHLPYHPDLAWRARSPVKRPAVLFLEDQVPHRHLGAGLPRAHAILDTLQKHFFVTMYPLVFSHEEWSSVYSDVSSEVEVIVDAGPSMLEDFLGERRGYYETILISRPHNMEVFQRAFEKHSEWFDNVNIIYDAEAIFALRDSRLWQIAGFPKSEDEIAAAVRAEFKMAAAADAVISVSDADREVFAKSGVESVHVLGHAIPIEPTPCSFEKREGFLFVGAMRKMSPNSEAVIWFVEEILPIINDRFGRAIPVTIAGVCDEEHVRKLGSDSVRVIGPVDDLRELYNRCRVFIAPTRIAAGIPHKVHEAAAHGLPSVVTPVLADQLGWRDGFEVGVGKDAEGFAERCLQLYTNEQEWQNLRRNALNRVEKECSVDAFEEKLRSILGVNGAGGRQKFANTMATAYPQDGPA